ncbi:MAG: hypothetical protein AAGA81_19850 [Acidobacteriota bacterium]
MSETVRRPNRHQAPMLALLSVLTVLFAFASVVSAQPGVKKANRLTFDIDSNAEGEISRDARTMTTQLPQANTINSGYRGRHVFLKLAYASSGSKRPEARFVQASAGNSRISCNIRPTRSPAPERFSCSADATWIRSLTRETRIKIEVGGAGVDGKLSVDWVIQPQAPPMRRRPR